MGDSAIKFCTRTWNPMVGCDDELQCFARCWARRLANRFAANPKLSDEYRDRYRKAFTVGPQLFHERLDEPFKWRKPQVVFVCSQGDLFHPDVRDGYIWNVFQRMAACQQHIFLVLTKRPERMADVVGRINYITPDDLPHLDLPSCSFWATQKPYICKDTIPVPNVWLGVSVEDQATADDRIPKLLAIPAAHHWVSVEPMIGPVDIKDILYGCPEQDQEYGDWYQTIQPPDWIVCGGESGTGPRPMHPDWPRKIRDDCEAAGVPFMFKQWGEWAPYELKPSWEGGNLPRDLKSGRVVQLRNDLVEDGHFRSGDVYLERVGKKKAGNVINGRIWDQTPWGVR